MAAFVLAGQKEWPWLERHFIEAGLIDLFRAIGYYAHGIAYNCYEEDDEISKVVKMKERLDRLLKQIESSTGQEQIPDTRRSAWRYTWVVPATAEVVDSEDSSEPLYITTRTISSEGLDFHSPSMLEPDTKILIKLDTDEGELQIPATVIHCTESVGMPLVGVTFDLAG